MVIENKQWSALEVVGDSLAVAVAGVEHAHPSRQAESYAGWLTDTHSAFVSGDLCAHACSFLHNLPPGLLSFGSRSSMSSSA